MIAESSDRACNTTINDIIITCDFNFNMLSNDGNKVNELMNQYNLKQIKREPTHYTESASSLIDLFLFRNPTMFSVVKLLTLSLLIKSGITVRYLYCLHSYAQNLRPRRLSNAW